ncbi:MAG: mechanosensitive ion channel [Candidatus Lokiarchaeota archaeon]|nr:mechanosensitive ion channel [Candidatus Lokiarchaeota archaeon]
MEILNFFQGILDFFLENIGPFITAGLTIAVSYVIYFIVKKQIQRLQKIERIDESTEKNMLRLWRIIIFILALTLITIQFAETLSLFAGLITVSAGTVIGFASMNTLGNLIAGIIIIMSKPFQVGDRIYFLEKIADVVDIKLIYTILEDIDGVRISIPNQKLLKTEIQNFKQHKILRREIFMTAGYNVDPRLVEKAALETAERFTNVLKYPQPRVDLYEFLDNTIQYRLIVFINNSKIIPKFDFQLRKAIYYAFEDYKIDMRTPILIERFNETFEEKPD